jgi:hypothetical protein
MLSLYEHARAQGPRDGLQALLYLAQTGACVIDLDMEGRYFTGSRMTLQEARPRSQIEEEHGEQFVAKEIGLPSTRYLYTRRHKSLDRLAQFEEPVNAPVVMADWKQEHARKEATKAQKRALRGMKQAQVRRAEELRELQKQLRYLQRRLWLPYYLPKPTNIERYLGRLRRRFETKAIAELRCRKNIITRQLASARKAWGQLSLKGMVRYSIAEAGSDLSARPVFGNSSCAGK